MVTKNICDTGETSKSINDRADDAAWEKIEKALADGAHLRRPKIVDTYFACKNGDFFGPCLTKRRVLKLEREGTLILAGIETYALSDDLQENKLPKKSEQMPFAFGEGRT